MTFSQAQVAKLLEPIHPGRVSKDGKGFSHIEAWEMRATLILMFGFGGWDEDVEAMELIFESEKDTKWTCSYRAKVRVTIRDPHGAHVCSYAEWAVGDAQNQPKRGDCHDMAVKTAQSQAFKRACMNLGDIAGLGLYNDGKLTAVVGRTLVEPGEPTPYDKAEPAVKVAAPEDDDGNTFQFVRFAQAIDDATSLEDLRAVGAGIQGASFKDPDRKLLREAYATRQAQLTPEPVKAEPAVKVAAVATTNDDPVTPLLDIFLTELGETRTKDEAKAFLGRASREKLAGEQVDGVKVTDLVANRVQMLPR